MATDVLRDAAPARGTAAAAGTDLAGIGALLRSARERRGQTLEHLAQLTKIPQRHLVALEQGNLAVVPGNFYQRAEIRTVAKAVGLDPDATIAQLERALAPPPRRESATKTDHLAAMRSGRAHLVIAIGVVAALALMGRAIVGRGPVTTALPRAPFDGAAATNIDEATVSDSEGASVGNAVPVDSDPPQDRVATAADALTGTTGTLPVPGTALMVTTQPPGARVTVNGIAWGVTPVTIRYLASGDKRIRVSLPGYETEDRVVNLGAGRLAVSFALRAAP
jgi:transcriptional regulator with XRE-family HTH domain